MGIDPFELSARVIRDDGRRFCIISEVFGRIKMRRENTKSGHPFFLK